MAKKARRKVSKSENTVSTQSAVSTSARSRLTSTDFNPDYTDIKSDLKRIGILAGSFFGVLIILSFFLR